MRAVGGSRGVGRGRVDERPQEGAGAVVVDAHPPATGGGGDAAIVAHRHGEYAAGAGGDRPPMNRLLRDRRAGGGPFADPALEEPELRGAHRLGADLVLRRRHEILLEVGRAEEDGALCRLAGDHAGAGIAAGEDRLQLGLALAGRHGEPIAKAAASAEIDEHHFLRLARERALVLSRLACLRARVVVRMGCRLLVVGFPLFSEVVVSLLAD